MALVHEDGTGLVGAESYATVDFTDTYLSERGFTLWATMSEAEKEAALRRGSDFMEQAYRSRWAGYRVTSTQGLSWPRYEVVVKDAYQVGYVTYYASDSVPLRVQEACAALGFKAAFGDLNADIERLKQRTKVGPIEVEYVPGAPAWKQYRAIDQMLAPFFAGAATSMSMRVVRA